MDGSTDRKTPKPVVIPAGRIQLHGDLAVPAGARGVVLFAHGSGSSRHSPRNRAVARALGEHGFATLLVDLLTPDEERVDMVTAKLRFDITLLAGRLAHAARWLRAQPETHALPIGVFGASTGGGAALVLAADHPDLVGAVVSRGGRPDLAGDKLGHVAAPTLLIVGGLDHQVILLNERALARLPRARLEIVPGATHLFEEPGALAQVARLAAAWFAGALEARPLGHRAA